MAALANPIQLNTWYEPTCDDPTCDQGHAEIEGDKFHWNVIYFKIDRVADECLHITTCRTSRQIAIRGERGTPHIHLQHKVNSFEIREPSVLAHFQNNNLARLKSSIALANLVYTLRNS